MDFFFGFGLCFCHCLCLWLWLCLVSGLDLVLVLFDLGFSFGPFLTLHSGIYDVSAAASGFGQTLDLRISLWLINFKVHSVSSKHHEKITFSCFEHKGSLSNVKAGLTPHIYLMRPGWSPGCQVARLPGSQVAGVAFPVA